MLVNVSGKSVGLLKVMNIFQKKQEELGIKASFCPLCLKESWLGQVK